MKHKQVSWFLLVGACAMAAAPGATKTLAIGDSVSFVGTTEATDIYELKYEAKPDSSFQRTRSVYLSGTCRVTKLNRFGIPVEASVRADSVQEMDGAKPAKPSIHRGALTLSMESGRLQLQQDGKPISSLARKIIDKMCDLSALTDSVVNLGWLPPEGAPDTMKWSERPEKVASALKEMEPVFEPNWLTSSITVDSISGFGGQRCKFVRNKATVRLKSMKLPFNLPLKQKGTVLNLNELYVVPVGDPRVPLYVQVGSGFGMDSSFETDVGGVSFQNTYRFIRKEMLRVWKL